MSAATASLAAGRYDAMSRRQALKLVKAGFDPDGPAPYYRTWGYRRSRNAHTVVVALYREP